MLKKIIDINKDNLEKYYWKQNGNLFFCYEEDIEFQVLDGGYTPEECLAELLAGTKFIYIEESL